MEDLFSPSAERPGGAVLVIALIPCSRLSTAGEAVPGIPQDIVVAAIGSIVAVGLAFALMKRRPRCLLLLFRRLRLGPTRLDFEETYHRAA